MLCLFFYTITTFIQCFNTQRGPNVNKANYYSSVWSENSDFLLHVSIDLIENNNLKQAEGEVWRFIFAVFKKEKKKKDKKLV